MLEVIFIPGDQGDVVCDGGGGDDRITQLHLLLLPQLDRLLDYLIIQRIGRAGIDEVVDGVGESAGINRLETENERVLQRKLSQ